MANQEHAGGRQHEHDLHQLIADPDSVTDRILIYGPGDLEPPGPAESELEARLHSDGSERLEWESTDEALAFSTPPYSAWQPTPQAFAHGDGGAYAFSASGTMYARARTGPPGVASGGHCYLRARLRTEALPLPGTVEIRPLLKYEASMYTWAKEWDWRLEGYAQLRVYSSWSEGDTLNLRAQRLDQFVRRAGAAINGDTGNGQEDSFGYALHPASGAVSLYVQPGELVLAEVQLSVSTIGRWDPDPGGRFAKANLELRAKLLWVIAARV